MATENSSEINFQEHTILIVDDNTTNLKLMADYLEGYGFDVTVALNGADGVKRAEQVQPSLILLDVMMPGIDGFETCRRLKANKITGEIPVIFMTALSSMQDKITGFEAGAVDYITKPLQEEEILARVTTHLKIRELTRSLKEKNVHLKKVMDELQDANVKLSKKAIQLETSNQVGQQVTSILDLDKLLVEMVSLIQAKFGYYFVGVWLLAEQQESLVLQAGSGGKERALVEPGFRIPLDTSTGIIIEACRTGRSYLADDVKHDAKYLFLDTLPETRSELALSLRVGQEMIGVLDIESERTAAFDLEDQKVLQTLANQIAIAIRNARLYELEKELRQAEAERARALAELNASKDKFFSILSHDLRGPFTNLIGNAQFMLMTGEELTKNEIQEMAQGIFDSSQAAYSLLENLLAWSKMQRGLMEYHPHQINLNNLARNTIGLLRETAAGKNIQLTNAVTPDTFIYADSNMIDTVIRNLTSNAIKFTPCDGQVTISAGRYRSSSGQEDDAPTAPVQFVEVSVSDTGIGISQTDLDKLFKIDVHHTTRGTAKEQGTGLGLIICKEMIEQNGGQIWVESKKDQGTTVKFTVPADISMKLGHNAP